MVEPKLDAAEPLATGKRGKCVPQFMGYGRKQPEVPPRGARDGENCGDHDDGEEFGNGHRGNVGLREAGSHAVPPQLREGRGSCFEVNHRTLGYRRTTSR